MASLGFIGLGISSVCGRGISKSSSNNILARPAKQTKEARTNGNAKIPFDVISQLRKMKEDGLTHSEIFANLGSQYMTYPYLQKVLIGDVRVWS